MPRLALEVEDLLTPVAHLHDDCAAVVLQDSLAVLSRDPEDQLTGSLVLERDPDGGDQRLTVFR